MQDAYSSTAVHESVLFPSRHSRGPRDIDPGSALQERPELLEGRPPARRHLLPEPLMVSSVTETATANGVNVNDRIIAINDESVAAISAMDFANKVAVAKLEGPVKITFETHM